MKACERPSKTVPVGRNAHSAVAQGNSLFIFGGQDQDNYKLGDLWELNLTTKQWANIKYTVSGHPTDIARSGHTAVAYGSKMYVFGGILEVTKELNDLLVYDFKSQNLVIHEQREGADALIYNSKLEETLAKNSINDGANSPGGRGKTLASPTRKGMGGMSPNRRSVMGQQSPGASAMSKSPTKRQQAANTTMSATDHKGGASVDDKGLSSPTSVSMQNSFIIKNADESFDSYYQQMKRRRHLQQGFT